MPPISSQIQVEDVLIAMSLIILNKFDLNIYHHLNIYICYGSTVIINILLFQCEDRL